MNSAFIQGTLGRSNIGVGRYNNWKYKFRDRRLTSHGFVKLMLNAYITLSK